ncbi:class I SAM-dependent methyltransferase [Egbenema bharatensis]|uniref:class I SAM-dependent methyltransferase n=1 Tax=Egbenema bharatensis TaxID=3463334 RepID=UPI003A88094B
MEEKNKSGECPICTRRTSPLFSVPCDYRKPFNSRRYAIDWCEVCDYGQVWERPSRAEIPGFYQLENYYTHNSQSTSQLQPRKTFFDRLRAHLSYRFDRGEPLTPDDALSLLEGDSLTICEIGCGNGGNLLQFMKQGFSGVGVEPDPCARDAAKKSGMLVFQGTAEELPEEVLEPKFDVVLMSHVLEHCLDINAAVSNAKRILKQGGIFIVETPNCHSRGFKSYQGEWPWSDIPRHLNFFTPSSLNLILTKYGFSVAKTKYDGFFRQFTNTWLENEAEIWQSFAHYDSKRDSPPNFKLRAWKLLLKSVLSSKAMKYDSIRLIAINS